MDDLIPLLEMSYMYGSTCTQQEEKFIGRDITAYTWDDAQAANQLISEIPDAWVLRDAWRKLGARGVELWRTHGRNIYELEEYWGR